MTTERKEYLNKLQKFCESASELLDAWEQIDDDEEAWEISCDGYPFCKSFDEMFFEILEWHDRVINNL